MEIEAVGALSEILVSGYDQVRKKLAAEVAATSPLSEVQVLAALTLRITRLAMAARLLVEAGLAEEANVLQRSAAEAFVNLAYIFYTGPRRAGEKSTADLAKQFAAYADMAYNKQLNKEPVPARRVWVDKQGMTEPAFTAFLAENARLADEAATTHGCTKQRWHSMNLDDMAKKVLSDPPPFGDMQVLSPLLGSFVFMNSATHGDALSMRTQYKANGAGLLDLVRTPELIVADQSAFLAVFSWRALGGYFGKEDWVRSTVTDLLRTALKSRSDAGGAQCQN